MFRPEKRIKVTFTSPSGNWMFSSNVLYDGAKAIINSLSRYIDKFVVDAKDPYDIRVVVPDDYTATLVTNTQAVNLEYARHGVLRLNEVFDDGVRVETDTDKTDRIENFRYVSEWIELTDKKRKNGGGVRTYKQLSLFDTDALRTEENNDSDVSNDCSDEENSGPVYFTDDDDYSTDEDYPDFDDDNLVPTDRPDEENSGPVYFTDDDDYSTDEDYPDFDDDNLVSNDYPDDEGSQDNNQDRDKSGHQNDPGRQG